MATPRIMVIGGGLAGMAAALALQDAGAEITLLEARARLGGRAGSFDDPASGQTLDNCQHVLLGCCTNLLDFFHRIGADHLIGWHRTLHFRDAHGRYDLTATRGLPAPLHLAGALRRFGALSRAQRKAVRRTMLAMLRLGDAGRRALAELSFGQWLGDQPADLMRRFYDPILISALNEEPGRASAAYAIQVFQRSLLTNARGYVLGLPSCPLDQLYQRPPCRDVRLGVRVRELEFAGRRVAAVRLQDGHALQADACVLAVNYPTLQKLVPADLRQHDARFALVDNLQSVPILGAHLWFDRPVMSESHAALLDGPLQWLFRKDADGRAVHGVISAARDWVDRPREQCLELFTEHIRSLFPAAAGAKLQRGIIVVEKRATFSPLPGVDRYRPSQAPPGDGIDNLFLAGDYTQTHWPATMEGAVRSGYLAAAAAGARLGLRSSPLVAELAPQLSSKVLGYRP